MRGVQKVRGSPNVAFLKTCSVPRIDDTSYVDGDVGIGHEIGQRIRVGKVPLYPFDPVPFFLRSAGKCADFVPLSERLIEQRLANEAGAACDGNLHLMTSWSRCTTAERGG